MQRGMKRKHKTLLKKLEKVKKGAIIYVYESSLYKIFTEYH